MSLSRIPKVTARRRAFISERVERKKKLEPEGEKKRSNEIFCYKMPNGGSHESCPTGIIDERGGRGRTGRETRKN